jgi:decaprenylphospho-beta-D-erythro-pentofuranosid-2-ulose 2-reductase
MQNAVIIGSTSGVGRSLAEYLSSLKYELLLCARSKRDLEIICSDLLIRYNNDIQYKLVDFSDNLNVDSFIDDLISEKKNYKNIFICSGKIIQNDTLGINKSEFESMINTNFLSIAYFLNKIIAIHLLENKNTLCISVITSIAVSRPRGNNITYATTKAAIDFYCRALQHRLWNTNISLKVIRLGYVRTSMTYGKKLLFPAAEPMSVARKLHRISKKGERVIYFPWYWRQISFILNILPWSIFKKLNF